MSESGVPQASHRDHPVWASLSRYSIGPEDAALSFAARLARGNGWTLAHAGRVIEEYRRFCFLAVTGARDATPCDAVDQAWHLHLTYTRDYWERFCPQVLGCALHHGPTAGGAGEQHRHFAQYADTLKRYEAEFGPPPADIWPEAARLLVEAPRLRRFDPRKAFVVPKAAVRAAGLAVAVAAAAYLLS